MSSTSGFHSGAQAILAERLLIAGDVLVLRECPLQEDGRIALTPLLHTFASFEATVISPSLYPNGSSVADECGPFIDCAVVADIAVWDWPAIFPRLSREGPSYAKNGQFPRRRKNSPAHLIPRHIERPRRLVDTPPMLVVEVEHTSAMSLKKRQFYERNYIECITTSADAVLRQHQPWSNIHPSPKLWRPA